MPIYQSAEDSWLLSNALSREIPKLLEKHSDLKFLEIGAGSGITLEKVFSLGIKKQNIFSSDVNPEVIEHCKNLGFNCVKSDLFEKIKGKFNVIAFNPPYLPEDKDEPSDSRLETTGGKHGNEISTKFLKQAKKHLTKDGKIFLVTSSLSEDVEFEDLGYVAKKVASEKSFFEELIVWEVTLAQ